MDFLRPILSGLVAMIVVSLLMRAGTKGAHRDGNRRVLAYSKGFRFFAALSIPLALFVAYAAAHARPSQLPIAMCVAAGFILGAGYLAYQAFLVRLSYDDEKFYYSSPFAGRHEIPWSSVQEIGYSGLAQCHYIRTAQVSRIWCSNMLQGYEELGEFLGEKLKDRIVSA